MRPLLGFFLPLRCLGCGAHLADPPAGEPPEAVCLGCRLRLRLPPAPRCPRCDLPRGTGRDRPALCGRCDDWPPVLVGAVTGAVLEPPADLLVQALKYGGWRRAAEVMADRIVPRLRSSAGRGPARIVPVPTTDRRRRRRGYNQARVLADALGRRLGLEVVDALSRTPAAASQVALPLDERRANVSGAFGPGPQAHRIGASFHTILVDDVLTTGATAAAAAGVLATLGATRVTLAAFARALPREVGGVAVGSSSS